MTIKQLVEELTDKRYPKTIDTWLMLQHSLYVRVMRRESAGVRIELSKFDDGSAMKTYSKPRPAVIIITNTPFLLERSS